MIFRRFFIAFAFLAAAFLQARVQADTKEFDPVPVTIERTKGSDLEQALQLRADVYRVWYENGTELRTYPVYDCDTDVGDGTDGNWHGYWNAKKAEKPGALAAAVVGIGFPTAKKIVDSNQYFKKKPRSWNAFRDEIRSISKDGDLGVPDVYYNVVVQHGKENAQNLGYSSETSCQWKEVTEEVPVVIKKREFLKSVKKSVSLRFEGGLLLTGEKEAFSARFDGIEVLVNPVVVVNDYQVLTDRDEDLILKATRRLAVRPDISSVRAAIFTEEDTLKLKVQDLLSAELKDLFANSALQVSYTVSRTAFVDNDEATGSIVFNNGDTQIVDLKTHPVWEKAGLFSSKKKTLVKGKNYYVKIQVQRLNTDAFNNQKSAEVRTSEITY